MSTSRGSLIATGRGALPAMAVFSAGQAMGNSRRRAAAAAASVPRWRTIDTGAVFVSTHGFYLQTHKGLHT